MSSELHQGAGMTNEQIAEAGDRARRAVMNALGADGSATFHLNTVHEPPKGADPSELQTLVDRGLRRASVEMLWREPDA